MAWRVTPLAYLRRAVHALSRTKADVQWFFVVLRLLTSLQVALR